MPASRTRGTVVGAIAGGVIGNQFGKGGGTVAAPSPAPSSAASSATRSAARSMSATASSPSRPSSTPGSAGRPAGRCAGAIPTTAATARSSPRRPTERGGSTAATTCTGLHRRPPADHARHRLPQSRRHLDAGRAEPSNTLPSSICNAPASWPGRFAFSAGRSRLRANRSSVLTIPAGGRLPVTARSLSDPMTAQCRATF